MGTRRIIVSGASRGIGETICHLLLKEGHNVIGIARDYSNTNNHKNFKRIALDLNDTKAMETTVGSLVKEYPDIDGLINNAGAGKFASLEEFSIKQIEALLQLNLHSAILLTRMLITTLKKQKRSDIVFMGSESGLQGARYGSVYCATKFGLRGFAQSLRHECASNNLHVGIINPGMVRSSFFDQLKFEPGTSRDNALQLEDVANTVLSLLNAPDHVMIEEINLNPLIKIVKKKHSSNN